jgi:hypothetical protein
VSVGLSSSWVFCVSLAPSLAAWFRANKILTLSFSCSIWALLIFLSYSRVMRTKGKCLIPVNLMLFLFCKSKFSSSFFYRKGIRSYCEALRYITGHNLSNAFFSVIKAAVGLTFLFKLELSLKLSTPSMMYSLALTSFFLTASSLCFLLSLVYCALKLFKTFILFLLKGFLLRIYFTLNKLSASNFFSLLLI